MPSGKNRLDGSQPFDQVVGRPRGVCENGGEAACLSADCLPPLVGRGRVVERRQAFGFHDARLEGRARIEQQGTHFVPLPARGHRQGESLGQSVSLRAVADERQERSPFFFNRNQLFEYILAVERLDPLAKGHARRNCLGAQAEPISGFIGLAVAAVDRRFDRRHGPVEAISGRHFGHLEGAPGVSQSRQFRR